MLFFVLIFTEYYQVKSECRDMLTDQANLAGLFGIENAKSEPKEGAGA